MAKKSKNIVKWNVGRDAITGQFISVEEARRREKTAIVETMKREKK